MKQLPRAHVILVLAFCAVTVTAVDNDVQTTSCDYGWSLHDKMCYLMRDEYETFDQADSSCSLFGAQLAYGKDKSSLEFLTKLVDKRNLYGWWYGIKVDYDGRPEVLSSLGIDGHFSRPPPGMEPPIPKLKELVDPETGCIGLVRDPRIYTNTYIMIDVPCTIRLPYICRGEASLKINDPTGTNVVRNDSQDVFWFSSVSDRRTYEDAEKTCNDKSMSLASIRGTVQMALFTDQLNLRVHETVDPWWIGMKVKKGVYSWSNGIYMDNSMVSWNRQIQRSLRYPQYCRILHKDGTAGDRPCYQVRAPYICMREHRLTGRFGCQHNWVRAGKSCYLKATSNRHSSVSYTTAESLCSKVGSHPISIDSNVEKTWLMQSLFYDEYSRQVWTSLSDRKKPGTFLWADGTAPKPSVLTWSAGNTLQGSGQCFYFVPKIGRLVRLQCRYEEQPGCQYPSTTGSCVSNKWKYYKGNCYYISFENNNYWTSAAAFPTQLFKCYKDLVQYSRNILISKLKIDSKEIMEFYKSMVGDNWVAFWTGLKDKGNGVFVWEDGTTADMSIFETDYYAGSDNSTSKCAILNQDGNFEPKSCTTYPYANAVCEKDYNGAGNPNSGSCVTSYCSLVQKFTVIWTMFMLYRLVF